MDASWHSLWRREGREKVDCKTDLGFKRGSAVQKLNAFFKKEVEDQNNHISQS
jgi:hypothetical protein